MPSLITLFKQHVIVRTECLVSCFTVVCLYVRIAADTSDFSKWSVVIHTAVCPRKIAKNAKSALAGFRTQDRSVQRGSQVSAQPPLINYSLFPFGFSHRRLSLPCLLFFPLIKISVETFDCMRVHFSVIEHRSHILSYLLTFIYCPGNSLPRKQLCPS